MCSTVTSDADPGAVLLNERTAPPVVQTLAFLLMTILTKTLFAFVCGDFVTFTFFSARHTAAKFESALWQTGYEL